MPKSNSNVLKKFVLEIGTIEKLLQRIDLYLFIRFTYIRIHYTHTINTRVFVLIYETRCH